MMQGFTSCRWVAPLGALWFLLGCAESAGLERDEAIERSRERAVSGSHEWVEKQRLAVEGSGSFASVVAVSGTTAIVGNREAGIYAYTLSNGEWGDRQELVVDSAALGAEYGLSAAVSGDTAVIGSPGKHDGSAAHVFSRTTAGWTLTDSLLAVPPVGDESFGASVAIEGDLVLVGAPYTESVYVFARSGDEWTLAKQLHPSDTESGFSKFGAAVGISGDLVAVGAPRSGEGDPYAFGQAYVYTKPSDLSATWPEDILAANVRQDFDQFGISVAVGGDTVLVGTARNPGAAYAFTKSGSEWSPPQELLAARSSPEGDQFGQSLAISGTRAVIGAPGPGIAYALVRVGTAWNQEDAIDGPGSSLRFFGHAVGISGDWIIVGAPRETPGGAAYAYRHLLSLGSACETNDECGSGHCVSNVCCNTVCTEQCEECSTGTCTPRETGSRGAPSCSPYFCDGSGRGCPEECVTNDDCVGTFFCRDGVCDQRGGLEDSCAGPDECLSGNCLGGNCSGTMPNGSSCDDPSECERGNCVDGVCCNDVCRGQCEACDVEGREGRCTAVSDAPHGRRMPCAGAGTLCEGRCNGEVADTCVYDPGVECGRICESDSETVSTCNGEGDCVEGESRTCAEFVCDDDELACILSCEADRDCADGLSCWADGACEPSPRCTDDGLQSESAPDGRLEDCGVYVCDGANGSCKTSCASSRDCAAPNVCDPNQRCVPLGSDEGGCGCRTASRRDRSGWLIGASLVILVFARRRVRRRAFASQGA